MGEFVNSGSGDAENGGNVCHVHHQGQFFQRVILFLVHLVFFLPFWESKLVCEWPKRITQSKFFILFSSRRHGGWTRRLRNVDLRADAQSACKTAPVGTTRPTPQSKRLRRCAFSDLCRSSAVNLPSGGGIRVRVLPASRVLVPKCYACAFLARQEKPKTQPDPRSV